MIIFINKIKMRIHPKYTQYKTTIQAKNNGSSTTLLITIRYFYYIPLDLYFLKLAYKT